MGKTFRDVENAGSCRILKTISSQRASVGVLDELREAGVSGNFGRIRQQAFRHTVKCPNTYDDAPVSGLDENNDKPSRYLWVWYVGGELTLVPLKDLRSYLDTLLDQGIESVEVWWGGSFAVLTYRSKYSKVSWTADGKSGTACWSDLERMLKPRFRYRFTKSVQDITPLLRKPSAATVTYLHHRSEGLIDISTLEDRLDQMKASDLIGGVVRSGRDVYTLDLEQLKAVFGKHTKKGRLTFTFWYRQDGERKSLMI